MQGSGGAASAALRGLPSDIAGKDWLAIPAKAADRKIIVTTNARVDMEAGLRPAVREREFRTSATAMLRHQPLFSRSPNRSLAILGGRSPSEAPLMRTNPEKQFPWHQPKPC